MDELNKILNRLPVISNVRRESNQLRDLLYERRSPRILAMGPDAQALEAVFQRLVDAERSGTPPKRGSAVASVGVRPWSRRLCAGGELIWLSLGTGDPDAPMVFREAFDRVQPDVVLLAAPVGEITKGADAVALAVKACYDRLLGSEARPKLLPALLLVGPSSERTAEDDLEAERARQALGQALARASLATEPTCIVSLDPFEPAERAGIEALSGALVELLPGPARVTGCRVLIHAHEARRTVASHVVQSCAALAITVAVTPIPLSDLAVIAPLQMAMVSALAYIGGRTWDRRTALEWVSSVGLVGGAGFGLRWGAQQLFKLVPGAGNVISAGIAGSGTAALGQAAMAYFVPSPALER